MLIQRKKKKTSEENAIKRATLIPASDEFILHEDETIIATSRKRYHNALISKGILCINENDIASNADGSNTTSKGIALKVATKLMAETNPRLRGQTAGSDFETITAQYVSDTFSRLQHLRPGLWKVCQLGNCSSIKAYTFAQYEHLAYLKELSTANKRLSCMLNEDYMVGPDIVIYQELYSDEALNAGFRVVDDSFCKKADLRLSNGGKPILHASISAKWTIRSDRSQNSRTEALQLIRHRRGHLPHIVVVTGEPLPSRLKSIAMGQGEIDCVYHFALNELIESVYEYSKQADKPDIVEDLNMLLEGKRLKDISDLPLDLCV